jgi:hypothetical protein
MRPETVMMINDAIDAAGAMFITVAFAIFVATTIGVLSGLFIMLGLMRLWRRLTVGSWSSAIRVTERKAFE